MPARLKVYRTHIGFDDWVVAAPNQKAALKAWDVRDNLFASGAAVVETDEKAMAAALKTPGVPVSLTRPAKVAARATAKAAPKPKASKGAAKKIRRR